MGIKQHYQLMAEYNQWMNRSLYAACAGISDDERKQDLGAFFRSIHGTLNHILWGDRIWLGRFTGTPGDLPGIGQDIYETFEELVAERDRTDAYIVKWVEGLDESWLEAPFSFTSTTDKKTRRGPAWVMVSHMFNHQTHHRGQVTTLVKQLGHEPPVTDIPWMQGKIEVVEN